MNTPSVKFADHRHGQLAAKAVNQYTVAELVRKWEREEITSEQVIGQILLHVQTLTEKVQELERQGERAK